MNEGHDAKMKAFLSGGGGLTRPLGLGLVLLVVASQLLVVYNLRNRIVKTKENIDILETRPDPDGSEEEDENEVGAFDEDVFEDEVAGPLAEMLKKFPDHPDMIINKLSKKIRNEEDK